MQIDLTIVMPARITGLWVFSHGREKTRVLGEWATTTKPSGNGKVPTVLERIATN